MTGELAPYRLDHPADVVQFHMSLCDVAKQAPSALRAEGDEIPTRPGVIMAAPANGPAVVRRFYRYQWRMEAVAANPFDALEGVKAGRRLPRVLHRQELEQLLEGLAGEDFSGRRDRLLVEFLYSTGCRISEAVGVNVSHIAGDRVKVKGKGSKERIVFLGGPAREALKNYLPLRTPRVGRETDEQALFLKQKGGRLTTRGAALILEKHARRLGLGGTLHPHTFRHSFATDLLDGGAEIREVQEMLGHASMSTTQIYTHLGIEALKQIHRSAHPHGREKR